MPGVKTPIKTSSNPFPHRQEEDALGGGNGVLKVKQ